MPETRVVIADDHAVLRSGLRLLIGTQSDLVVVGEAGNFNEALCVVRRLSPDVLLVDFSMPGGSAVGLIETLSRECPGTRCLVLTMHDDPAYLRMVLAAGASGYLVKTGADTELLTAIRTVARGGTYAQINQAFPAPASLRTDVQSPLESLSEREREVLALVAQGHTNQAVADRLYLSVKTVESYRARLMSKLGLQNRAELTRLALDAGLLEGDKPGE